MNIFPSRQKVRNILIRHCCHKEIRVTKNYQHPENFYFVKYFPKYYTGLALEMKPQYSLLSKLKRVKKLKIFTGNFKGQIPQVNWFKIFANNRKEMEEFPRIPHSIINRSVIAFWSKTRLQFAKFFFQITKLSLPALQCWSLNLWGSFVKQLRSMRRLKILEVEVERPDSGRFEPFLKSLNRMPNLLRKLEVLKCSLRSSASEDIFSRYKNLFSYLTHLNYVQIPSQVSSISQAIPKFSKNLKSFSLKFEASPGESYSNFRRVPKFQDFITPIQELSKIQSISINWSSLCSEEFWSYFNPPASLRNLKLEFNTIDLIKVVFKAKYPHEINLTVIRALDGFRDFMKHWRNMKELDILDLKINCKEIEEMIFTRNFITAVLEKVKRLNSFTCRLSLSNMGIMRYEPFLVEKVTHLSESLKKFEMRVSSPSVSFDFGLLKIFKNLKQIDFQGNFCSFVNIEDAISVLEDREFATLRFGSVIINYKEELKDLLKKITQVNNLKIVIALKFSMEAGDDNEMKFLDEFCEIIESKNTVKGLETSLEMEYRSCSKNGIDEVKRVLDKYPGIRNFVLKIYYHESQLEYIKRDGEKVQLFLESRIM